MTLYFEHTKEECEMGILETRLKLLKSLENTLMFGNILLAVMILKIALNL